MLCFELERFHNALFCRLVGEVYMVPAHREFQILAYGHRVVQGIALEEEADTHTHFIQLLVVYGQHVFTHHGDTARVRFQKAYDAFYQYRFSRA